VTELVLTEERREELAPLLDDEQRLRAEYPKVVDYLDMAPKLPGTGNAGMDAAFDLRFVHYMTGDASVSTNPYWDIVAPSVFERGDRRVVNGGNPDGSGRLAYAQIALQAVYAYAIPAPETLDWTAEFCSGRRLIELGAGRGYWGEPTGSQGPPGRRLRHRAARHRRERFVRPRRRTEGHLVPRRYSRWTRVASRQSG